MPDGQHHASSHRLTRLAPKLADKAYRNSYVAHQTRQFLARQVRALRGDKLQTEFSELLKKPQSVVSRLENPNYGKWTLQTLFDVAASLDRAVIVRIVDYPTFLRFTSDMSAVAAHPEAYKQEAVDSLAHVENVRDFGEGPSATGTMDFDPAQELMSARNGGSDLDRDSTDRGFVANENFIVPSDSDTGAARYGSTPL